MNKSDYVDDDNVAPWQQDTMIDELTEFQIDIAERKKPEKRSNNKTFKIPIKGKSLSPIIRNSRKRKTTPDLVTKEQGCEPMD